MTTAELGTLVGCIENKRIGNQCTRVFLSLVMRSSAKDNINVMDFTYRYAGITNVGAIS